MTKSLGYISLGCAKNLVDTEVMLRIVERMMVIPLQIIYMRLT